MRFRSTNVGLALAVFAGVVALGLSVWPVAPQAQQFGSTGWLIVSIVTALAYLVAGFVSQSHTLTARALLLVGPWSALSAALSSAAWAAPPLADRPGWRRRWPTSAPRCWRWRPPS